MVWSSFEGGFPRVSEGSGLSGIAVANVAFGFVSKGGVMPKCSWKDLSFFSFPGGGGSPIFLSDAPNFRDQPVPLGSGQKKPRRS